LNNNNILSNFLLEIAEDVDKFLDTYLKTDSQFSTGLIESIRYSIFAGGKRLRAGLVVATYQLFSDKRELAIPFAAAIEMIHTYSLIHDDLPSMDNDDYRRGKLTNHKVFGEALAILSGDTLLTKAFELINDRSISPEVTDSQRVDISFLTAESAGDKGMIAGQVADILFEGEKKITEELLRFIHIKKSAELIKASVGIGAKLANADDKQYRVLQNYAESIGLAFQITDDILDITSSSEQLGKTVGKDVAQSKVTYPAIFGVEGSSQIVSELIAIAKNEIEYFGADGYLLNDIATFILTRDR